MIDVEKRKKRQKKYYAEKRKTGRCVTCGKSDERTQKGFVYCEACNVKRYRPYDPAKRSESRKNAENADKREWAKMRRNAFLCVACGRKDSRTVNGKGLCIYCATRINSAARERRKYKGDVLRAQAKSRKEKWEAAGLCSGCGHPKEEPEFKLCCSCRLRYKLNRQRRERERGTMKQPKGENGRCWQCNRAMAMEGKRLCPECYAAKMETIRKSGFLKGGIGK